MSISLEQRLNNSFSLKSRRNNSIDLNNLFLSTEFQNQNNNTNQNNIQINQNIETRKENFIWKPNPFLKYKSYTYRWRFFMTSEDLFTDLSVKKNDIINSVYTNKGIILCETGSTGLNIKDVYMENFVTSGFWNSNTFVTKFNVKIFEPLGISFLDYLIDCAKLLNIKNFSKCPYFLLLDFVGIDENGEEEIIFNASDIVTNQQNELLSGNVFSWLWKVAIVNFDIDFTNEGSLYNIEMIPFNDMGFRNNMFLHKAQMTLEPLKTFGDFLEAYKDALNKQFLENNEGHKIDFNINTKIEIDELGTNLPLVNSDIRSWQIVPSSDASRNIRASSMADKNATAVHIQKGGNISSLILEVINTTQEAKILRELPKYTDDMFFITWIVKPEIKILNYNNDNKIYNYEIIYNIIPQRVPAHFVREYRELQENKPTKNKEFLLKLNKKNLLSKRYDYLFTGLNTEVLNLNLNFNNMWVSTIAAYSGRNRLSEESPSILITQEIKNDIDKSSKEIIDIENIRKQVDNYLNSIRFNSPASNLNLDLSSRFNLQNILINSARRTLNIESQNINEILTNFINSNETTKNQFIKNVNNNFNNQIISSRRSYGLPDRNYIELVRRKNNEKFPISILPSFFDNRSEVMSFTEGMSPGSEGREKLKFANMLNEMKSVTDLLSIEIEIRGDPYWLGSDDFNYKYGTLQKQNQQTIINSDFYSSIVMFLLRFGIPENFQNLYDQNLLIDQYDNFYNGIYFVTSVESTFSKGKFTQKLKSSRLINLEIPKEIL